MDILWHDTPDPSFRGYAVVEDTTVIVDFDTMPSVRLAGLDASDTALLLDDPARPSYIIRNLMWAATSVSTPADVKPDQILERTYRPSRHIPCPECDDTVLHAQTPPQDAVVCLGCRQRATVEHHGCSNCDRRTAHAHHQKRMATCTRCGCRRRL